MKFIKAIKSIIRRVLPTRGRLVEAYHRVLQKPYIFKDPSGLIFEFNPSDAYAHWVDRNLANDDPGLLVYMQEVLAPGNIVFDVGAHVGSVTLAAGLAMNWNGSVISFEPASSNYRLLCNNIRLNSAENICVPLKLAVTDRSGEAKLHLFPNKKSGWHSLGWFEFAGETPQKTEIVQSITLDDFCYSRSIGKIDFLKIDIEGAEPKALKGAGRLIENHAIRIIVFELSLVPLNGLGYRIVDVVDPLLSTGYIIRRIKADGTLDTSIYKSPNDFTGRTWANFVAIAPGACER